MKPLLPELSRVFSCCRWCCPLALTPLVSTRLGLGAQAGKPSSLQASFLHGHLGRGALWQLGALGQCLLAGGALFLSHLLAYARKEISAAKWEQQVCWAQPLPRVSALGRPVSFTCGALVSGTCRRLKVLLVFRTVSICSNVVSVSCLE